MIVAARRAVLPGAEGLRIAPARVHVDGARIVAVEADVGPAPGDDDVGDRLLAPAFVDAHTHLALGMARGLGAEAAARGHLVEDLFFRLERALAPGDVRAFATVGAVEALLGGSGLVADHYYAADEVLAACRDVGLGVIATPALQDLAGPGVGALEAALDLTARLADDPTLADDGCAVALGPHAPDTVSDALWRRVADEAERRGLPVHAHAAQSAAEVERLVARTGRTPLAHLDALGVLDAGPGWRLVHAIHATEAELVRLRDRRVELVACPRSSAWFAFPPPVHRWTAHGVRWSVGSDGGGTGEGGAVRRELGPLAALAVADLGRSETAERWRQGVGPLAAVEDTRRGRPREAASALLARVTSIPGALHPRLPAGRLAPGHLANLTLWDLDHPAFWPAGAPVDALVHGDVDGALAQVMVVGRWRGERGRFAASLRDRHRDAFAEARARWTGLVHRVFR